MNKSDRQRLRSLVIQYIEGTLKAVRHPEKVLLMYDYSIQTKYGLLRIAIDRDYEGSELFTLSGSYRQKTKAHYQLVCRHRLARV